MTLAPRRSLGNGLVVAQLTVIGLLLSGLVVATWAPGRPVASTVRTTVPRAGVCADVLLLGARGSGEAAGRPADRAWGGTLNGFRARYAAEVARDARTLEQRTVLVGAPATARLYPRHTRGTTPASRAVRPARLRDWKRGVTPAVDRATAALRAAADACPAQQVVLVGYAQGAMVLHRALLALGDRPDILGRVVAAVLVADGDRASSAGTGAGVNARLGRQVPTVPQPGTGVLVAEVCSRGDLVCDLRGNALRSAVAVHRGYRHGAALARLRNVAARVAERTDRLPLPPRTLQRTAGQVGLLMDARLRVRVAPAALAQVVWENAAGLPAGVSLTRDGRLRGVPEEAGTFQVTYTVRNPSSAAFDRATAGSVDLVVVGQSARTISAGGQQSCQTHEDGTATCWGRNNWGQLGDGSTTDRTRPVAAGSHWTQISTNGSTTCAVRDDRTLWCWGLNQYGQVGDGTRTTRLRPVRVGSATTWTSVSTGWGHTCGTVASGNAYCWGYNTSGQVGDGTTRTRVHPRRVLGQDFVSVTAGGWFSCGVTTNGTALCWGADGFGQLGNGSTAGSPTPTPVGYSSSWASVSASWAGACGVKTDGELRCWGLNDQGQVGDGTTTTRINPTLVAGGRRYTQVTVGDAHACAVDTDAALWCWGDNRYGQLGDGTRTSSKVPVTSGGVGGWYDVDAGWLHTCGIRQDGTSWCWGNNENGQVGDGTSQDRKTAVPVP